MVNTQKLYAMIARIMKSPIFKGGVASVAVSGGNYTFNLDTATVFDASITASGGAVFTCSDPTKTYQFQINATTTGAYNFTSFTMSGVSIYKPKGTTISLLASGRTTLGGTYDGPGATLDLFTVQMEAA